MSVVFKQHVRKLVDVSEEELTAILSFFETVTPAKKVRLLEEGKVCRYDYFVVKGCLRLFFVNNKGVEKTIQFAIENWWIADYTSLQLQIPSEFCIQAVETSEVLAISVADRETMLARFPKMERYFRLVHQKAHAAAQYRTRYQGDYSKEELYLHFSRNFPEFAQRVPQHLLASYLGLTPEYLSELRARRIS
ncbi:Crp/Fnr family transcriptional regulator [Chitinophaga oryzae]|uniref:Crp/Fnr family transcriptional regulator n=1 Tax=Chitinophaga oryzae TaxID=2725414 RepID=A0AAE6ZBX1_9BACT|nr:Crp/Fnr family transcriptional regulator [Chitinophaga oryzae]QJB30126.1 Crp/Fnr family transcriptional regulator [Chitinophaga oryzae]QJB36624.1 Crp/Fnr family transcriptional regulator [Chitinophaga oryzae]